MVFYLFGPLDSVYGPSLNKIREGRKNDLEKPAAETEQAKNNHELDIWGQLPSKIMLCNKLCKFNNSKRDNNCYGQ